MKRVHWFLIDYWEGIYVDGKVVDQGHRLFDGDPLGLLKLAEQYKFTSEDVHHCWINKVDVENWLMDQGAFPERIEDLPKWKELTSMSP